MMDFSLNSYKDEIVDTLQKFIRIPSVKGEPQSNMPYGKNVFDALMFILNKAEHLDFDSVNMFSHLGYVEYGDGDDLFVILTHIDVVPAGDGWTHDPFGGEIIDGKIYGRGTIDDKGAAVIALYALNAIKENCKILNKRVRLIFGCDEESGWSDMDFYKQQEKEEPVMAISPDADFPVINFEKGLLHIELSQDGEQWENRPLSVKSFESGERVNIVPSTAKCILTGSHEIIKEAAELFFSDLKTPFTCEKTEDGTLLTVKGRSSHGSKPQEGENAASYLIMFLNTLPLAATKNDSIIYDIAKYIGLDTDGRAMGIDFKNKLGDLTLNLGVISLNENGSTLKIDIRYPENTSKDEILSAFSKCFPNMEIKVLSHHIPHHVDENSPLVQGLFKAYEEITGEKGYPISIGGATYAKVFKNSVAFGPVFPWQEGLEHQADECIDIASLITAGDIIANAILTLCE